MSGITLSIAGTTAITSIACAVETARGLSVLLAVATAGLVWLAARGSVHAGGGSTSGATGAGESGGSETGAGGSSTGASGTTVADSTAGTSATDDGTTGEVSTSACLSAPESWSDTGDTEDPELAVCLCACTTGGDGPEDWAPGLLLPVLARRRNRRQSLDRLAARGVLPTDVVERMRRQLDDPRAEPRDER